MVNARDIKEWKDQWNHGDVKFVPDLFRITMDLLYENENLKYQIEKDRELHQQLYRQLEVQNKHLMERLMKIHDTRTEPMAEIFIPAANITEEVMEWVDKRREKNSSQEFLEELRRKMMENMGVPVKMWDRQEMEKGEKNENPKS